MSNTYTGVKVIPTEKELIDKFYAEKELEVWGRYAWYENLYVVLKDENRKASALAKVRKGKLVPLLTDNKFAVSGVKPRNKEQCMALDALLDDNIKIVVLTGRAGTGKTLMAIAAALHRAENKRYNRIIMTRPRQDMGSHKMGELPGNVEEKFSPWLANYYCNLEYMLGGSKKKVDDAIEQYGMEFVPLAMIRGASWGFSFIIADEVQTLDHHEMVTLGTRVGEGSKIVIMGDLAQRDKKIAKEKTGIYHFVNSEQAKNSPLVASIELLKSERSDVSELFASIFEAY